MAEINHNVHTAKAYIGYAAKGAAKLSDMSKAAQKMAKAGEELGEIDKMLADMAFLSQISAGLQAASMGMSVLATLLPIKTKQDLIYDAVIEIDDKLDAMKDQIANGFKQLDAAVWTAASQTALERAASQIKTAHGRLAKIAVLRKEGKDYSDALDELKDYHVKDMRDAVGLIEDYVVGTPLVPNVLKLTHSATYGDGAFVFPLAVYLVQMAHLGVSTAAALKSEKNALKPRPKARHGRRRMNWR